MKALILVAIAVLVLLAAGCTANQRAEYHVDHLREGKSSGAYVITTDALSQTSLITTSIDKDADGNEKVKFNMCRSVPASVAAQVAQSGNGSVGYSKAAGNPDASVAYGYTSDQTAMQLNKAAFLQSQDAVWQVFCPWVENGYISNEVLHELILVQFKSINAQHGEEMIREMLGMSGNVPPSLVQDLLTNLTKEKASFDSAQLASAKAKSDLTTALAAKTKCSDLESSKQEGCNKASAAADAAALTAKSAGDQLEALQALARNVGQAGSGTSKPSEPGFSDSVMENATNRIADLAATAGRLDVQDLLCLVRLTEEQRRACDTLNGGSAATSLVATASDHSPTIRSSMIDPLRSLQKGSRLYIQIGSDLQEKSGNEMISKLRAGLGNSLGVAPIEVREGPRNVQLRYYGSQDEQAARALAAIVRGALGGTEPEVIDWSKNVDHKPGGGLFELWIPSTTKIDPNLVAK